MTDAKQAQPTTSEDLGRVLTDWLTVAEAGDVLQCHVRHVRRLIDQGSLHGFPTKLGWLISRVSVEARASAQRPRAHRGNYMVSR